MNKIKTINLSLAFSYTVNVWSFWSVSDAHLSSPPLSPMPTYVFSSPPWQMMRHQLIWWKGFGVPWSLFKSANALLSLFLPLLSVFAFLTSTISLFLSYVYDIRFFFCCCWLANVRFYQSSSLRPAAYGKTSQSPTHQLFKTQSEL